MSLSLFSDQITHDDVLEIKAMLQQILQNQVIIMKHLSVIQQQQRKEQQQKNEGNNSPPLLIDLVELEKEDHDENEKPKEGKRSVIRKHHATAATDQQEAKPVEKPNNKLVNNIDDWLQILGGTAFFCGLLELSGVPPLLASLFV